MNCIEGMGLSEEQKVALFDTGPRVLVAAGAGSGKTRLLVAYFVRALVEEGIPPERLVAVTFTRKAAAELVTRIRSALEECGRADLARSLDSATVGTIHGLCRRLIDENALEADVDPVFRVLEAEATALVKEEANKRAWDRVAEQADEAILEVLASRSDSLRKEIVPLYDRLRGMGWECPQVEVQASPARRGTEEGLRTAIREALSAGCAVSKPGVALQADLERLQDCLQWLDAPLSLQERAADLAVTQGFFPSRKTRTMEPSFEPVRAALTRYRQTLADVRLESLVDAMNRLLKEFHSEYTSYKRERSLLDFADLELRARALVAQKPGEVSRSVLPGSRVLIDEFQDTNEVQCGILEGLRADRLLMVGDERQSIYR
ncbi:MAG: UvrD-helicase domain-containing protein, partial [Thermoleophilia bacterium]|nr:UvrD-helicase domain-containing protein [Thermoleophilia bacterium]